MPTSLRLGALLFASVSADQISLMQDVKKSSKRDGKHMSALMESAKGMLKNGATPDVVSFAEETLADIAAVVIPAIVDESRVQQNAVLSKWTQMRYLIDHQLPEWKQTILQWSNEVTAASSVHQECRRVEHGLCYGVVQTDVEPGKRPCEMELYRLWTIWVDEETDLREFHNNIDGHFCPPGANGTLHAFRVASVPLMTSYMSQKAVVDLAETAYDNYRPQCIVRHNDLDRQSTQCNQDQDNLESKACSEMRAVQQTLEDFEARYTAIHVEWVEAWQNVRTDELMRHREYKQIKIVECLLNRIHELNGRPCDDATGEVDTEMSHCRAEGEALQICAFEPVAIDSTLLNSGEFFETRDEAVPLDSIMTGHVTEEWDTADFIDRDALGDRSARHIHDDAQLLGHEGWKRADLQSQGSICIVYPEEPERLDVCPDIREEPFLPCTPPHPCDADWIQHQVLPLPVMPQGTFSATNPGCNQYPPCRVCESQD